jgi:hypothetical protein
MTKKLLALLALALALLPRIASAQAPKTACHDNKPIVLADEKIVATFRPDATIALAGLAEKPHLLPPDAPGVGGCVFDNDAFAAFAKVYEKVEIDKDKKLLVKLPSTSGCLAFSKKPLPPDQPGTKDLEIRLAADCLEPAAIVDDKDKQATAKETQRASETTPTCTSAQIAPSVD